MSESAIEEYPYYQKGDALPPTIKGKKSMTRKVYRRNYDNNLNADGTEKENVYLGEFEVLQQISGSEGEYSEQFIGKNIDTGIVYLIDCVEVLGFNGGTRYTCTELTFLTTTQAVV